MTNEGGYSKLLSGCPEPGQLVEVRRRHWVVSDVQASSVSKSNGNTQHLVHLASLDEDTLGEELQTIWQLEPGAQILEKAGLPQPTGTDPEGHLEAFIDAVRWGAVTNADKSFLQAPFRSGITIEDYQLEPLVRAIEMARVNLLIADDVGLGKTIEAGLVVQEMIVRHRARSVFIVCPASLQIKWRDEMREKFGLEFKIVDTEFVGRLRRERGIHANPWTSFPRLIGSIDWIKNGEGLRLLKDMLPPQVTYPRKLDILVVDEAHNVAPSGTSRYLLESQRTRLVRVVAPHFEHKLFLSATPHNGYRESFTSLLELLDDQRFARSIMPDEKQLQSVMVRRLKDDIVDEHGNRVFPIRKLEALEVDYSDEERAIHRTLHQYAKSRESSVHDAGHQYGVEFLHKLLKKRLFSSPMAFATTLAKYREGIERARPKKSKGVLEDKILKRAITRAAEDYADDSKAEDAEHEAVEAATKLSVPLTGDQHDMLDTLTAWAENARNKPDSKADAILNWLSDHLKADGQWNSSRVILFTEYRATLSWLEQILTSHGYGGDRLMILHGSLDQKDREPIKAAFQANPQDSPVRILLATDAASEGIDLQNHCNYLIHVEISWNPNVMEQRNGRIDRHGQKQKKVYVWHPVGKGFDFKKAKKDIAVGELEGDVEFLLRSVLKTESMREDIGSVSPVIAHQVEEAMLGKRDKLDTAEAEAKAARARKLVAAEKRLQEKIARLHDKLMEAKTDFHLSPEHIARAVTIGLELAEKQPLIHVSFPNAAENSVFDVPVWPGSWGRSMAGLEHPHTGKRRPITFDHDVAKGRDDVVLVHLNHRLVQMCLRLLREELWKLDDIKKLHRVIVKVVSDSELSNPAVIIWSRLVITGGDHQKLHEEITLSGGELKTSGYARIPQLGRLEELMEKSSAIEPGQRKFEQLKNLFTKNEQSILSTVEARSKDRLRFLKNTLQRRMEKEKENLESILTELEETIRRELKEGELPEQLTLEGMGEPERNQIRKDLEALKVRLDRIPEEKKLEQSSIVKRYDNLTDRTFPVAVVFLIPKSQAKGV